MFSFQEIFRPLVQHFELDADLDSKQGKVLLLDLFHPHAAAGTSPREILEKVLGLTEEQSQLVRIVKRRAQEVV